MLKVSISNAEKISLDIFRAKLNPSQVRFLGEASISVGSTSIIHLGTNPFEYDSKGKVISFDPQFVNLFNVGNTDDVLILITNKKEDEIITDMLAPKLTNPGDMKFLNSLPNDIQDLGKTFLGEVRKHFNGDLKYYKTSGKFVESPNNFWTVRIQNRDKSLRITVRGIPSYFSGVQKLLLKDDMAGYSSFKVNSKNQVNEAINIISQAANK
jgi:hypothetical protein